MEGRRILGLVMTIAVWHQVKATIPVPTLDPAVYCKDCRIQDGIGFNAFPGICTVYVQCYFQDMSITKARGRQCAWGTIWDQVDLTCVRPKVGKCDLCSGASDGDKRVYHISCLAYVECLALNPATPTVLTPRFRCCDAGNYFDSVTGQCQPDTGQCLEVKCPVIPDIITDIVCPYTASTDGFYLVNSPGMGAVQMQCPNNYKFSEFTCGCHDLIDPSLARPCEPALHLNFDSEPITDLGLHKFSLFVQNVNIPGGSQAGVFDGQSKVMIWGFANKVWGDPLFFQMKFKTSAIGTIQTLLHNCDCENDIDSPDPSLLITLDTTQVGILTVAVTGRFQDGNDVTLTAATIPNIDSTLDIQIKDHMMVLSLDGSKTSSPVGRLSKRHSPLVIGSPECLPGSTGFQGEIDEIVIVNDCISPLIAVIPP